MDLSLYRPLPLVKTHITHSIQSIVLLATILTRWVARGAIYHWAANPLQ